MKISVIIPTCHRNDLLAKCLDCLAPGVQTLPADQYEVIVTDDGTRSTAEEMVCTQYPWAQWVAGPKRGPATNRNNGAALAQGEWLAFTDDDCLPEPFWLMAYAVAFHQSAQVYEGKTICKVGLKNALEEAPLNLVGGCLWSCNMMVRKTLFNTMGGFTTLFSLPGGEDVDFRKRLESMKQPFLFVEEAAIDHPPRKRRWGKKAALMWEMQTLLLVKDNPDVHITKALLWTILRVQLKILREYRLSLASIVSLASMPIEMYYVVCLAPQWKNKHLQMLSSLPNQTLVHDTP